MSRTLRVLVTESPLTHVRQFNGSLGAGVHEPVTADRVEFGGCDDLGEFLHVRWLDIHNVEALVLNVEVPQVDAEVIATDKGLAVAVHRDAIYMVRVGVGICFPWDSGHHSVVVCQSRQLQR